MCRCSLKNTVNQSQLASMPFFPRLGCEEGGTYRSRFAGAQWCSLLSHYQWLAVHRHWWMNSNPLRIKSPSLPTRWTRYPCCGIRSRKQWKSESERACTRTRQTGAYWPAAAQFANPHPDRERRRLARVINIAYFTCFRAVRIQHSAKTSAAVLHF